MTEDGWVLPPTREALRELAVRALLESMGEPVPVGPMPPGVSLMTVDEMRAAMARRGLYAACRRVDTINRSAVFRAGL